LRGRKLIQVWGREPSQKKKKKPRDGGSKEGEGVSDGRIGFSPRNSFFRTQFSGLGGGMVSKEQTREKNRLHKEGGGGGVKGEGRKTFTKPKGSKKGRGN